MILEGGMIGLASFILVLVHPGPIFESAWKATSFFSKQPKSDKVDANDTETGVELVSEGGGEASKSGGRA